MKLSHRSPAQSRRNPTRTDRAHRRQQGYSLIMTALLIVPMLGFSALGVDVAAWYTRAMEVQRAADAAAMAAVVWMPNDFPTAEAEARRVAARNDLAHDPLGTGVTVTATPVSGRPQEIDVTVTDPHVGTYFGSMFIEEITITRKARARYVLPVPLGSPHNTFGNQNLNPQPSDPKLWASINGPYSAHQDGDPYAVKCQVAAATPRTCNGSGANPNYRPEGYRYIIDVPAGSVGRTLDVEVFDGPFVDRGTNTGTGDAYGNSNPSGSSSQRMALSYELFEADATPLTIDDNPTLAGRCQSPTPGRLVYPQNHGNADRDLWRRICRVSVSRVGQYVLVVKSSNIPGQTPDQGAGLNQYSLKATLSGAGAQPRLYAHQTMSIFTNMSGTEANLYLTEVEQRHAGKTLRISLFDPGDGSAGEFRLRLVNPAGQIAQCRFNEPGTTTLGPVQSCSILTRSTTTSRYNNQWLHVEIPLASSYTCNAAGATPVNPGIGTSAACWWRVNYLFSNGATPYDRTTWTANILGDPVQLIQ